MQLDESMGLHTFCYKNPVTRSPAMSMRDHQILKIGDVWYMTGTAAPYWKGESPGVHLFQSTDLLNWTFVDWLIDASKLPADCFYKGRFWAPEIHPAHGQFYLTVNCGHGGATDVEDRRMEEHAIILMVADKIAGPYELITRDKPIGKPFKNDASLFTDEDERSYIYCSGGGLWQAEIDLSAGKLIGRDDLEKICSPRDPGIPAWMIGGIEGPFVIKRDGWYHLFFSAWTRGYEVGVMRSRSPLGPWELASRDPVFGTRKRRHRARQMEEGGYTHLQFEDTPDPYAETGHCAIFEGPDGKDWFSCHYLKEGQKPIGGHSLEYADSMPQLGIEPLRYREGVFLPISPTWTEQIITW
jgi:xylan 1,4-beta-xylosidase